MIGNKFRQGKKPWNFGKKNMYSEETLEKMRFAKLGKKLSLEHIEKLRISSTERKQSEESKRKTALAKMGDNNPAKRSEVRAKMSETASRPDVIDRKARLMPYSGTSIELLIRKELERQKISFEPNYQILDKYNVDIFIKPNIVIECDGDYWHNLERVKQKDLKRDAALRTLGFQIYRFWESEIKESPENCINSLKNVL